MPGEDLQSWSVVAADNGNADTSINWQEHQPRASVNNSARALMAAHAKDRNLKNGSITTGGTANAQTFTSGVTYTTTPTGLWVRLKIGVTNTGTTTLNMDSIGAVAIKDRAGNDLTPGTLILGQYAEFIYNGTNWIYLGNNASTSPQSGRLAWVSVNTLSFLPYNGDQIKIAGVLFSIPPAGIVGLANTGVFVNGVAGQLLLVNTIYYVYVFVNGGVLTADFSTTTHGSSSSNGNVGTEIKSGDDSRTLIGMIRTNQFAEFSDNPKQRLVFSWFNRKNKHLQGESTNGIATSSTTLIELGVSTIIEYLQWADEDGFCSVMGSAYGTNAAMLVAANISFDGIVAIPTSMQPQGSIAAANFWTNLSGVQVISGAGYEGYHYLRPMGAVNTAVGFFYISVQNLIRG